MNKTAIFLATGFFVAISFGQTPLQWHIHPLQYPQPLSTSQITSIQMTGSTIRVSGSTYWIERAMDSISTSGTGRLVFIFSGTSAKPIITGTKPLTSGTRPLLTGTNDGVKR
jgi:hypothetical protein